MLEAKSNGADVILLISELLSASQIRDLSCAAYENRMEVLLELHNEEQIQKINTELNNLIGLNNRNLENFVTDINTTVRLSKLLPGNPIIISESGINDKYTMEKLKDNGINAVLIGEYLRNSKNMKETIKEVKEWCQL